MNKPPQELPVHLDIVSGEPQPNYIANELCPRAPLPAHYAEPSFWLETELCRQEKQAAFALVLRNGPWLALYAVCQEMADAADQAARSKGWKSAFDRLGLKKELEMECAVFPGAAWNAIEDICKRVMNQACRIVKEAGCDEFSGPLR